MNIIELIDVNATRCPYKTALCDMDTDFTLLPHTPSGKIMKYKLRNVHKRTWTN